MNVFSVWSLPAADDAGVIGAIDQHPRQCVDVEIDLPAAVRAGSNKYVGHYGLSCFSPKRQARLGIETTHLGDHVVDVLLIDSASFAKSANILLGDEIEILQKGSYRRVEAVALLELERQAFRQTARADAGRIKLLNQSQ